MLIQEQYSEEARIQLNFFSFMTVAVWVCFGAGIAFSITLHLVFKSAASGTEFQNQIFWFSSLMYGFLGFIFSLIGAAVVFPVYKLWCERTRGQSVKGKFAFSTRN
jgi:H+/Cl- antiporter ClcA